jgi:hypothetical protein
MKLAEYWRSLCEHMRGLYISDGCWRVNIETCPYIQADWEHIPTESECEDCWCDMFDDYLKRQKQLEELMP